MLCVGRLTKSRRKKKKNWAVRRSVIVYPFLTFHLFTLFFHVVWSEQIVDECVPPLLSRCKRGKESSQKTMSSNISNEEHDPVANLTMLPARSILKTSHSIDDNRLVAAGIPTTGMKRSESKR